MNTNLITVCVTTFNRKEKLMLTIQSILLQTYTNIEIIIIDDCSTDGTQLFVENTILMLDKRIKYIKHIVNKGLATARNTAINTAKGKYFTFCDDDDVWSNNFLEIFSESAENYDDTYSFCSSIISNDTKVKAICSSFKDFILLGYTPPVASQFYHTKALKELGGYDEDITSGVDHDLWLTLGFKSYNLVWLNRDMVTVNQDETEDRMTFNVDKRVSGIKKSMKIWKNKIGNNFGERFFSFFEKNYKYNTYKKYILLSIKNKDYSKAFSYLVVLPKQLFLLDIKRYFNKKFKNEETLIHPTFTKCIAETKLIISRIEITRK